MEEEDMKIRSVHIIKEHVLEPIEELLLDTSEMSFRHIKRHELHISNSKLQLASLNEALLENRCINDQVKSDVEETVQALKRVIPLLEDKLEMYKQSCAQKNNEIDISNLSRCFHDPQLFQQIIQDILVVYEDPTNNLLFGEDVRKILKDLNKIHGTRHYIRAYAHIEHCKWRVAEVERRLEAPDSQTHKDDLCKAHKSLARLLELCKILTPVPKKEIK